MRLISLEAENVFSLGHVTLDLENRKILLVTGFSNDDKNGNGAGKSSLANHAIVWGLFGQTYDGTKGDAVINRNSDKKFGKVEITFEDINGKVCKVVRTRNPNSLKLIEKSLLKEAVVLGRPSVNDTQEMINKRLGRDFSTFIHSDLIGPGTERSFFRLSGAEQVSVLENLLPVHDLEEWTSVAKSRAKQTQARIQELEGKRNQLIGKRDAMEHYMASIVTKKANWKQNIKEEIHKQTENVQNSEAKKDELEAGISELVKTVGPKWAQAYSALKTEYNNIWLKRAELGKEVQYLAKIIDVSTCEVCRQEVLPDLKENARGRLNVNKSILDDNLARQDQLNDWLVKCDTIKDIQGKIEKHNTGFEVLRKILDNLKSAMCPYESEPVYSDIVKYTSGIKNVEIELASEKTSLHWFDFWANAYGRDLRTMMIEEVCPFLEQRINEYLVRLGNPQFKATVSTVKSLKSGDIREKFNLEVKSDHGASSFDLLSVGEKQIVSFAASLAVADLATTQVSGRSNILILDEPFMGLARSNCDNIINFLNQCDVETILLISNDDSLKELVSNRIHIVKTKGQSWLE